MVCAKDPAEIESAHAGKTRARDDDVGMTAERLGQPFRTVLRFLDVEPALTQESGVQVAGLTIPLHEERARRTADLAGRQCRQGPILYRVWEVHIGKRRVGSGIP